MLLQTKFIICGLGIITVSAATTLVLKNSGAFNKSKKETNANNTTTEDDDKKPNVDEKNTPNALPKPAENKTEKQKVLEWWKENMPKNVVLKIKKGEQEIEAEKIDENEDWAGLLKYLNENKTTISSNLTGNKGETDTPGDLVFVKTDDKWDSDDG